MNTMKTIKKTTLTLTQHVIKEREKRMTYILTQAELCSDFSFVIEVPFIKENKRECLTRSGVLFVKALDEEVLITAYVPTIDKVYALYKSQGKEVPYAVKWRVLHNKKHVGKF